MLVTAKEAFEVETHKFVVEASVLGLPPGEFPESLRTTLGNRQPFVRVLTDELKAVYRQSLGCISLHVLND